MKTHNNSKILQYVGRMRRPLNGMPLRAKTTTRVRLYKRVSALAAFFALLTASFLLTTPSNWLFSGGSLVSATTESIVTTEGDYTTLKNTWNLGQTAHARVDNAPVPGGITPYLRRVIWVAPDGSVAQVHTINTATANDDYAIQSAGAFAQTGKWAVKTIDNRGVVHASVIFSVLSPTDNANVSITETGPATVVAGSNVTYSLTVTNNGPDTAHDLELTSPVPANTTFVSETQDSGPTFSCATGPDANGVSTTTCTISTLAASASATFSLVYNVGPAVPNGTVIGSSSMVSTSNETNGQDNTANATTTVSNTPPPAPCTVNCPTSPISQNNDAGLCTAVVSYTTPGTTGSCANENGTTPPVVCSPPSGSAFPVGTTQVTCSSGGNSCTFNVTVNDTRDPVAPTIGACPSNITVNENPPGTSSARVNYTNPSATGNCVTVSCSPPSGSLFVAGTTTVNCTATDSANNTATCSFTVTVQTTTCGIDCPDDKTVNESSPGSGSAVVTYSLPTTVGTCPSLTISCSPPSGSTFNVGATTVNCTGNDTESHVYTTCSFGITVNRIPTCSITCPANVTAAENPSGSGSATVNYTAPTKNGNCTDDPVVCNPPSGSSFPIGTTTVHCTASDQAGNAAACSFTVTVTGGNPCVITCPANITDSSGGCGKTVMYPDPTTSGSCGDPNTDPPNPHPWSCNPPSGSFFPAGTTTVVCSTDVGAQCSFTVTISGTDATAPTIISCAPPRTVAADSTCQAVVPNMTSDVDANDNCTPSDQLVVTQTPAPGGLLGTGTHTITFTVRDASNNTATCTTTLTVSESIPPTALCKNATVFLDAAGNASVSATAVDNGSTDNCGIATRTVSPSTFTCANKGANTVTLTVTDASGNSDSCQATVTVVDNLPPTITCPANITQSTDPNLCSAVVTFSATATDNCPGVGTPACTPPSGSTFPKGTTSVTCTVSDASSNSASCQFTVTVNDTQPPTITCPANVIQSTDPNLCTAVVTYANATATDNCPGVGTPSCSPPSGSIFAKGTSTVTCTVSDASSNSASCQFTVTVNDTQLPAITCPANIVKEPTCPAGAVVTFTAPVGTDNCPGAVTTQTAGPVSGSIFPIGTTTVTFKVTDTSGNMTLCSFTVKVKTPAEVVQDLIARVQLLQSQGKLTGQQAQGLTSKLQAALDAVNDNKINVACNKLADFISQVSAYINNGTLTSADGQPLINSAANVRNTLGCTSNPCS